MQIVKIFYRLTFYVFCHAVSVYIKSDKTGQIQCFPIYNLTKYFCTFLKGIILTWLFKKTFSQVIAESLTLKLTCIITATINKNCQFHWICPALIFVINQKYFRWCHLSLCRCRFLKFVWTKTFVGKIKKRQKHISQNIKQTICRQHLLSCFYLTLFLKSFINYDLNNLS